MTPRTGAPVRATAGAADAAGPLAGVYGFTHRGRWFLYQPAGPRLVEVNEAGYRQAVGARAEHGPAATRFLASLGAALPGTAPRLAPGPPRAPAQVSLFLTEACNLRCVYCYAEGGASRAVLPAHVAAAAIERALDLAASRPERTLGVSFHGGGEPTLAWPVLTGAVELARRRAHELGVKVSFSLGTNGVLSPERAGWIAQHLDSATLSIDGEPGLHDLQRPRAGGAGSFAAVVETARTWDRAGFRYGVRVTVTAREVDDLTRQLERICDETAARTIQAEPVYPTGRAVHAAVARPEPQRFATSFLEARARCAARGRTLRYSGFELELRRPRFCEAAAGSFCVTPRGLVTSCYEVARPDDPRASRFIYGRWLEPEQRFALDEVAARHLADLGPTAHGDCDACFCLAHCAGDCPAKHVRTATGWEPDPARCVITRAIGAELLVAALDGGQPPEILAKT